MPCLGESGRVRFDEVLEARIFKNVPKCNYGDYRVQGLYRGCIGINTIYWGNSGIVERKMEGTGIMGSI